ncbi:glutathione S-transferase family protein [Sphingomonas sp. Ag1]|jgi:glutathione S-transferase|uniref:glutathione S-transferase family protein n=2 Tax=Sphingomonas TaxID=13687 RepID=UPI000621A04E|nr:glutathione S-transferase family protein [Sphingomonas sp. Ag1]KKI17668.1 glutathione S-transferase [Sphingomonas sp. Ag1]
MIELYHCADARSFRALWALEELGLDYKLHLLPFPPRVREPSYLDVNPLGTIPLLVEGETRMTESAAIVQYLATRAGPNDLVVEPGSPDYGVWLNWLHFGEATLTFPQTLVLRYRMLEPPERRLPQAADDYAQWFHSRLRHVERALGDREYLVGGRFTAAEISVGYALLLAKSLKIDNGFPPQVAAYWERLKARDGFSRAKEAQKAVAAPF